MAQEPEEVQIDDLINDVGAAKRAAAKAAKATHVEGRVALVETVNNVYPMLESMLEKMGQMEAALLDVLEGGELLMPETAAAVLGALQLGEKLAQYVTNLCAPNGPLTDIQRAEAQKLCLGYVTAMGLAKHAVESLVDEEPEEDAPPAPGNP